MDRQISKNRVGGANGKVLKILYFAKLKIQYFQVVFLLFSIGKRYLTIVGKTC